jgi:hypothetical protein
MTYIKYKHPTSFPTKALSPNDTFTLKPEDFGDYYTDEVFVADDRPEKPKDPRDRDDYNPDVDKPKSTIHFKKHIQDGEEDENGRLRMSDEMRRLIEAGNADDDEDDQDQDDDDTYDMNDDGDDDSSVPEVQKTEVKTEPQKEPTPEAIQKYSDSLQPKQEPEFRPLKYSEQIRVSCSRVATIVREYLYKEYLEGKNITLHNSTRTPETILGGCIYFAFLRALKVRQDEKGFHLPSDDQIRIALHEEYAFFENVYCDERLHYTKTAEELMEAYRRIYGDSAGLPVEIKEDLLEQMKRTMSFLSDDEFEDLLEVFGDMFCESLDDDDSDDEDSDDDQDDQDEDDDDDSDDDDSDDEDDLDDDMKATVDMIYRERDRNRIMLVHREDDAFSICSQNRMQTYYVDTSVGSEKIYDSYTTDARNFNMYGWLALMEPWKRIDEAGLRALQERLVEDDDAMVSDSLTIIRYQPDSYGVYWLDEDLVEFIDERAETGLFMKIFFDLRDNNVASRFESVVNRRTFDIINGVGDDNDMGLYELIKVMGLVNNGRNQSKLSGRIFGFSPEDYMLDLEDVDDENESDEGPETEGETSTEIEVLTSEPSTHEPEDQFVIGAAGKPPEPTIDEPDDKKYNKSRDNYKSQERLPNGKFKPSEDKIGIRAPVGKKKKNRDLQELAREDQEMGE